jgi:hypothetical protein
MVPCRWIEPAASRSQIPSDRANGGFGSILLKNSVSPQGRKISRDMERLDREVPRAYLSTTFASSEFALIGCTGSCWHLTLSTIS